MFEYLENNPETWKFQPLPTIPEWFEKGLVAIAGLNRHGQPNLRVVKGNEIKSDRSENAVLKYQAGYGKPETIGFEYFDNGQTIFVKEETDVPDGKIIAPVIVREELGMLRYIIEKWTSPEELEAQHRFQNRFAQGDLAPTLRTFPREGVYDVYYIVENAEDGFRELDERLLTYLKFRWKFETEKTATERAGIISRLAEAETQARARTKDEVLDACIAGDIRLPQEEKERREEYWRTQHDYMEDARRGFRVAGL